MFPDVAFGLAKVGDYPIAPFGETVAELRTDLALLLRALDVPALEIHKGGLRVAK